MNFISIVGAAIVTIALVFYSLAFFAEQKKQRASINVLRFYTIGIFFDIAATICMILGSTNSPFTFHGFIGYSALFLMIIDTFLIWRSYAINGINSLLSKPLHVYSRISYLYWVAAYITGGLLVYFR